MIISAGLFIFLFCLGMPFCRLLGPSFEDRFSAAPVLGLALIGIAVTIGYFSDLPFAAMIAIAVTAAVIGIILSFRELADQYIAYAIYGVALCMALTLPSYLSSYETNLFHTNPTDQINYLSLASGFNARSATQLSALDPDERSLPIFTASIYLHDRPTVPLLLALSARAFGKTTAETIFRFTPMLQAVSAFGIIFMLRNVFRVTRLKSLFGGTAFAIGFFPTYIADINALSSLSALSFLPAVLTAFYGLKVAPNSRSLPIAVGIFSAAIIVFYPESVPAATPAAVALIAYFLFEAPDDRPRRLRQLAAISAVTSLLVLPIWQSTLWFLFKQLYAARVIHDNWISVFDTFYAPYSDILNKVDAGRLIDLWAGASGLFFLAPPPTMPAIARALWRCAEVGFLALLFVVPFYTSRKLKTSDMAIACLSSFFLPVALVFSGDLWAAGKAVTMISPLIFCTIASPIANLPSWPAAPAAVFLLINLVTGAGQIVNPKATGIFKEAIGYPKAAALLDEANWNVPFWKASFKGCHLVNVAIVTPHLSRVIETILLDTKVPYKFTVDRMSYYFEGEKIHKESPDLSADCLADDKSVLHLKPG